MTSTITSGRTVHEFATVSMDTLVHVNVVSDSPRSEIAPAVERALTWFAIVEAICSRFEPESEVVRLSQRADEPVTVSRLLLELVEFALTLAAETDGAFDPTVGAILEQRGIATSYRTGRAIASGADPGATYRDVTVDRARSTITLRRPLVLDLNAVAKGLAIDLAARDLRALANFSVEAGGDLYLSGHNADGKDWHIGVQHPRADGLLERTFRVSDGAVCTSGDYERGGHIVDNRDGPASDLLSVTVLAPTALVADGLSTAALVLGAERGRALLEAHGVRGLLVGAAGEVLV
jgi:thiamine biosynthesis lipoprotein